MVVPEGKEGPVEGQRVCRVLGGNCQEAMDSACVTHD